MFLGSGAARYAMGALLTLDGGLQTALDKFIQLGFILLADREKIIRAGAV